MVAFLSRLLLWKWARSFCSKRSLKGAGVYVALWSNWPNKTVFSDCLKRLCECDSPAVWGPSTDSSRHDIQLRLRLCRRSRSASEECVEEWRRSWSLIWSSLCQSTVGVQITDGPVGTCSVKPPFLSSDTSQSLHKYNNLHEKIKDSCLYYLCLRVGIKSDSEGQWSLEVQAYDAYVDLRVSRRRASRTGFRSWHKQMS